ncbi:bifunctional hydroxymethylpyrimidine kinase/phosphomethylpyrimidine kinase [Tessaracoccus timonensis]|uniref:bifunctional hydroxymethylpyrimidine kinase/phosphomethylpyrimidine kinase n=1 Tax=Tessaracoccus timonensis TaxID=2161816 RepID=UPI001E3E7164|nr:bifunctional hydroxymethylpyrimidine kinase/phosphomethylpyrimidine kinase [Tessaracoccus timonensis]
MQFALTKGLSMALLHPRIPRVLSIAGSDPSGGAGIQADLKSITAAGGYGMAAITALTAQNTQGVVGLHVPDPSFLTAQLNAISADIEVDAVKTGMLATADVIRAACEWLERCPVPVLVVDPVMVATSGDRLLAPEAEEALGELCRRANVITPNIGELAVLTGAEPAQTEEAAITQARGWSAEHRVAVVVKTGHLTSLDTASNHWVSPDGAVHTTSTPRLDTTTTHGTGCSLSSALATRLGAGDSPDDALSWATDWLHEAIAHGADLDIGGGHGPVDHGYRARRALAATAGARA